jgi:hypothetical protein
MTWAKTLLCRGNAGKVQSPHDFRGEVQACQETLSALRTLYYFTFLLIFLLAPIIALANPSKHLDESIICPTHGMGSKRQKTSLRMKVRQTVYV